MALPPRRIAPKSRRVVFKNSWRDADDRLRRPADDDDACGGLRLFK